MATQLNKEQLSNLIRLGMVIGMKLGVDKVRDNNFPESETQEVLQKISVEIIEAYQHYSSTGDDTKMAVLEKYVI